MNVSEIMGAMQAVVDLAESEQRALSTEEVENYEKLEADLKAANKTAELYARQAAYKAPVVGFPSVIKTAPKGDAGLEFAFEQYLRTGQANSDLTQLYSQNEGTNTAGGYTVPTVFLSKLTERLVAFGGLRGAAGQLTTNNGAPILWASVDDTSATRADIAAEGAATAAGADITFGTVTMNAYRYTASGTGNNPVKVSVELLQDSAFDISGFVSRALGTRIARKQAVDFMQASGSGAPKGLLYGSHTGNTVLAAGGAVTYAKLNALVHQLDPAYRPGASWIFNDATAATIEGILDNNLRPLLQPSAQGGIAGAVASSTLLGYPVIIDQAAFTGPTSDNVNFAAFGDLSEAYMVRNVRDIQVIVNPYTSANTGFVEYNAFARADGQIVNANAVVKLEGHS